MKSYAFEIQILLVREGLGRRALLEKSQWTQWEWSSKAVCTSRCFGKSIPRGPRDFSRAEILHTERFHTPKNYNFFFLLFANLILLQQRSKQTTINNVELAGGYNKEVIYGCKEISSRTLWPSMAPRKCAMNVICWKLLIKSLKIIFTPFQQYHTTDADVHQFASQGIQLKEKQCLLKQTFHGWNLQKWQGRYTARQC